MYLIDIDEKYPNNYWLEYDTNIFPDSLSLKIGKPVNPNDFKDIYLSAKSNASIKNLTSYDYLFSNGPDVISKRLAKLLTNFSKDSIQLLETKIRHKGKFHEGFYIVNYLSIQEAFDMANCIYKPIIDFLPDGPKKFTKITLIDLQTEKSIFRCKECLSEVAISNDVAREIKESNIKGIQLLEKKLRL
ncbi:MULTISPECIES: hypothetical protein [unclassified Pseudomonas]|uniref:hypothetical protein n=1 Tax=unclassified Pseudomonas TaxID=196821 RepID=UPI000EFB1359|nr:MULTISPECIES: hypothetical protein [unclassified Pseudomonas]AYN96135.1 hypothetical protein EAW52_20310 [Pseudomonas sp. LTJR-52]MBW5413412.1 hypothetical protein [Pseudomonas sp. MAG002Y]